MNEESILLEAERLVHNDRNDQYGDAKAAFQVYANIANVVFGIEVSPETICKILIAVKLGRLKYKYKRDSAVDTCGYLEILNQLYADSI